jgi:hypothetical protein
MATHPKDKPASKVTGKGRLLEAARKKQGMTRRQVVDAFNPHSEKKLHEITLYKYEKNELQLPRKIIPILAAILKIDASLLGESTHSSKSSLVLGSLPYLDSEFLAFTLRQGGLDYYNRSLPELNIDEKTIKDPVDLLERLADGKIHLALFNTNEFEVHGLRFGDKIENLAEIVRYAGYSVLFVPPEKGALVSFQECFNRPHTHFSRRARLESALFDTLVQLVPENEATPAPEILFATGSDRRTLLNQLQNIAGERADRKSADKLYRLKWLINQADQKHLGEDAAYQRFLQHLEGGGNPGAPKNGAIFVGTLTQRLVAEERGANILISPENLLWLAGLLPAETKKVLQPSNALLVNRKAYELHPEQFGAVFIRWNAGVELLNAPDGVAKTLPHIAKQFAEELNRMSTAAEAGHPGTADPFGSQISPAEAMDPRIVGLFSRIYGERMVALMPHLL